MSRLVTIYNTQGSNRIPIESDASTWGQLKVNLASNSIPYTDMKAIIGDTQVTLESSEALLPLGDFTIMLFPQKVKSGSACDEAEEITDDMAPDDDENDDESRVDFSDLPAENSPIALSSYEKMLNDIAIIEAKVASVKIGLQNMITEWSDPETYALQQQANDIRKNLC